MSYILTALRKSEAERAKGAIPRPGTRHEFEAASARRGRFWPMVAVGALLFNSLLVAFVLWQPAVLPWTADQQTGPAGTSVAAAPDTVVSAAERAPQVLVAQAATVRNDGSAGGLEPARAVAPENGTSHQIAGVVQTVQPAATHAASADKAATTQSATPVRSTLEPVQNNGTENVLVPAAAPLDAAPDGGVSGETVTVPQTQTAVAVPKPAKKKPQQAIRTTLSPKPVTPAKKTAGKVKKAAAKKQAQQIALAPPQASAEAVSGPTEQASDPYADVPELWRMPRGFRTRVPKFSISVHVYAPEDQHRFIIVDRKKYGEGDRLKSGVLIEAILPAGVVFELNGQKFKLTSS